MSNKVENATSRSLTEQYQHNVDFDVRSCILFAGKLCWKCSRLQAEHPAQAAGHPGQQTTHDLPSLCRGCSPDQ